jgi:pimeloyl-ACP methyl ester carboxylesterase
VLAAAGWERVRGWSARRSVIVGTCEQFFPADSLHALAPDELHLVDGADHFLFDRDEEVAALVARCLERHAGEGRSWS